MAILYGAVPVQELENTQNLRYDALGKNSSAFTAGDPLTIASGLIDLGSSTSTIVGVAAKTQTMASNNQTVGLVYPAFYPVTEQTIFLMGTNADLTGNATDGGTYYKLAGTTGIVQVDVTSGVQTGANRVVEIVKVDPYGVGGTGSGSGVRQCYVRFVKTPYLNVTITA